jgi:hypothetical protein
MGPAIPVAHVKWVPCHCGMAHPQVALRGDGLQIWRVAASLLNKPSRIAESASEMGGFSGMT